MTDKLPDYLNDILTYAVPKVSYNDFKNKYLPLILNKNPAVFNSIWVNEVAISPHARVSVIATDGTEVYSVPPLCDNVMTSLSTTIPNVVQQASLEAGINVNRGIMVLSSLLPVINSMLTARNPEHIKEWQVILEKEGYQDYISYLKESDQTNTNISVNYDDDGWS